ncbi:hypothetical protein CRYUN_Cryun35bG0037400 [Craigia yunnanensis]
MASSLDRWEKDPFFSVAEEVQESADRMESAYRTWIHAKKDVSGTWNFEELRRDLRTALGTTKWQESALSEGKTPMPWVRLDEGIDKELVSDCLKNSNKFVEWSSSEAKGKKSHGHRRTASASADIGAWKIAITDGVLQQNSSNGQPSIPPRKVPSFSGFLNSMESVAKLKWSKNGVRKWKTVDSHQESDTELLRPPQLARGINAGYERSCLDCDDCYDDKQLYGWYGAIQRQLQRSQYQMQYSRPIQLAVWFILFLCLIGEFA